MNVYSALLYCQVVSFRNRLVTRLKRLRQPKYLVGGIVGGLYFYFYFFRHLFQGQVRTPQAGPSLGATSPDDLFLIHSGAALGLAVILLLAWIIPRARAALAFTEAEVAFLFPAPVTRRQLIHFKLLRSQGGIFLTVLLLTLITQRFGGRAVIHAAGWWLILSTLNLHLLGASFARTLLLDRGVSNTRRRLAVLLLAAAALTVAVVWAGAALPPPDPAAWSDPDAIRAYLHQLCASGPVYVLLAPFRWVLGPCLAPGLGGFLQSLPAALGVMALHYLWVIRSDVAFEEASADASRRLAEKVAAVRAGNWQAAQDKPKARRDPFHLRPEGSPVVAIVWKNLVSARQGVPLRLLLILVGIVLGGAIGLGQVSTGRNLLLVGGFISALVAVWALVLGPQVMRQDFRQDLAMVEWLKVLPLPGWQMALGQLLAPALVLTAAQSLLFLLAAVLLWTPPEPLRGFGGMTNIVMLVGLVLTLPGLNLLMLSIPNATVLLFPAWTLAGKDAPQGIEVMGQRIIALLAQMLVVLATLVPAGLFGALAFLGVNLVAGLLPAIVAAAAAAALILAAEAALAIHLLGLAFDRLDPGTEL